MTLTTACSCTPAPNCIHVHACEVLTRGRRRPFRLVSGAARQQQQSRHTRGQPPQMLQATRPVSAHKLFMGRVCCLVAHPGSSPSRARKIGGQGGKQPRNRLFYLACCRAHTFRPRGMYKAYCATSSGFHVLSGRVRSRKRHRQHISSSNSFSWCDASCALSLATRLSFQTLSITWGASGTLVTSAHGCL